MAAKCFLESSSFLFQRGRKRAQAATTVPLTEVIEVEVAVASDIIAVEDERDKNQVLEVDDDVNIHHYSNSQCQSYESVYEFPRYENRSTEVTEEFERILFQILSEAPC